VKADYGEVRVELLDAAGDPLSGFERAACHPVAEDSVDAPVRWAGAPALRALGGRPVRLRFTLANARLYAYRCLPDRTALTRAGAGALEVVAPGDPRRAGGEEGLERRPGGVGGVG
jgi:hypothetical protein